MLVHVASLRAGRDLDATFSAGMPVVPFVPSAPTRSVMGASECGFGSIHSGGAKFPSRKGRS